MRRRHALRSAAALVPSSLASVTLAGCLDDDSDGDDGDPSDHEQQAGSRAIRLSAEVRESEEEGEDQVDHDPPADYDSVTLESDCLDEPRTLDPGESTAVRRDEAGGSCSFTVLVDGEQRHEGGVSGAETYELRVAPDGSASTERIVTV